MKALNQFLVMHFFINVSEIRFIDARAQAQVERPHPVWWLVSVRLLLQATAQRIVNHLPEGHLALARLLFERVRQIVIYR